MRVSRSVVLAVIGSVLCLFPAAGVGAQDASEAPAAASHGTLAVEVTGTFTTDRGDAAWTEEDIDVEGGRRQRGAHHTGRTEMSDPRLSGDVTGTDNADRFCDGRCSPDTFRADVHWGPFEISNDGGTWVGTMVGTSGSDTYYELVGTGAYEGLSAIVLEAEVDGESALAWNGVIVPGDLPPAR